MLQFTDLNDILHVVHIRNVTHVQFRETRITSLFHFILLVASMLYLQLLMQKRPALLLKN